MRFSDGTEIIGPGCGDGTSVLSTPQGRVEWLTKEIESESSHVSKCNCNRCDAKTWLDIFKEERETIERYLKKHANL